MSDAPALHSDHLNFLIYRYLQEFGHEKTARAFYRDWHRPAEHDDPESFPFAHTVQRKELVSVIQEGLHHDKQQAHVRKCERRFPWAYIDPRESVERQDVLHENGAGSRPPSRTQRKTRLPTHVRTADDFHPPAPKRSRRSEGSEPQVNGERDAMDVDAASGSADADDDNDAASPAAASDAEGVEAMVRYDSMEVGTQTDVIKTSTMHWKIDRPGVRISQCIWNPSTESKNATSFIAVGESLCRFYQLPDSFSSNAQSVCKQLLLLISHADEPSLPPDSIVTSTAWRPDGSAASCAIDSIRTLPDGSSLPSQSLVEYSRDSGSVPFQPGPTLLEPPGIVLQLRYSPGGEYLLLVRTNLKRGSVQVWRAPQSHIENSPAPSEPIAWRVFEQPVHDGLWTAENAFVVCGANGFSSLHQLAEQDNAAQNGVKIEPEKPYHGLVEQQTNLAGSADELDKLRIDNQQNIYVFCSTSSKRLVAASKPVGAERESEANYTIDLPSPPTDLGFQPRPSHESPTSTQDEISRPSYLAVAFEEGNCIIYGISRPAGSSIKCIEITSLFVGSGPALALSWSPNGQYLAVSGTDLVQIWHADSLKRRNGVLHKAEPVITWRRPAERNGLANGTLTDERDADLSEPSLSWSTDGESLVFAVEQQIAIIRFRPPLTGRTQPSPGINGRPSP